MTNLKKSSPEYRVFYKLANALTAGLAICFPLYLWLAGWENPLTTAIYLGTAGGIRFIAGLTRSTYSATDWLMISAPIALALLAITLGARAGLYYPVVINLGLLLIFHSSLSTTTNFIQRIAEKIEKRPLDSVGIRYTAGVTRVWCAVFSLNALIAAFLAWHQMLKEWVLYNGVIAYLVTGFLLLGEWAVRPRIRRKMSARSAQSANQHD